jgi:hypothetical protein
VFFLMTISHKNTFSFANTINIKCYPELALTQNSIAFVCFIKNNVLARLHVISIENWVFWKCSWQNTSEWISLNKHLLQNMVTFFLVCFFRDPGYSHGFDSLPDHRYPKIRPFNVKTL